MKILKSQKNNPFLEFFSVVLYPHFLVISQGATASITDVISHAARIPAGTASF